MKTLALVLLLSVAAVVGFAQTPPPPSEEAPIDTSTVERILKGEEAVESGQTFSYEPAGRRDPFRSLLKGMPREEQGQRPPGLRGMGIEEIKLQGVMKLPEGFVAMIQGTDNLSYLLRAGTEMYDGNVERIEAGRVVFRMQVTDPKSLKPYREVVRTLR